MPIKATATSVSLAGIVIALAASSAGFGIMELLLQAVQTGSSPVHNALIFLPEFGAAVLVALFFGSIFRTRFTPVLALSGLVTLAVAAAVLTQRCRPRAGRSSS